MTLKLLLPVSLAIFSACSQPTTRKSKIYVVPHRQASRTALPDSVPQPPLPSYYLPSNFIIDSNGELYYYQQARHESFCATPVIADTLPPFINLQPKDIVSIPADSIADFIRTNLLKPDGKYKLVSVASVKDTLQSESVSQLFELLKDPYNKIMWTLRKTTQEENVILQYKLLDLPYHPDAIVWDSTKVR